MKKLTINELNILAELLSQCQNDKDLKSPSTIITGIRLTKSVHSCIKKYFEEQKELFTRFDVEQVEKDGTTYFDWSDNPAKEKINQALAELNSFEYSVEYLNKIDEEDFIIYTRGLNNPQIVFLYDYLVKED
jgi:hypothetical protein